MADGEQQTKKVGRRTAPDPAQTWGAVAVVVWLCGAGYLGGAGWFAFTAQQAEEVARRSESSNPVEYEGIVYKNAKQAAAVRLDERANNAFPWTKNLSDPWLALFLLAGASGLAGAVIRIIAKKTLKLVAVFVFEPVLGGLIAAVTVPFVLLGANVLTATNVIELRPMAIVVSGVLASLFREDTLKRLRAEAKKRLRTTHD